MSDFRIEALRIPGSPLGGKNPLPVFKLLEVATAGKVIDESVPSEDREYLGTHLDTGCLPFRLQDDYDRSRQELRFTCNRMILQTSRSTSSEQHSIR